MFERECIIKGLLKSGLAPTFFLGLFLDMAVDLDRKVVEQILERVTARLGLELVHWEAVGPRNNLILRVYIDKPGGVTHADCEMVSKQVSMLLDVEDPIPDSYTLEISSPGIERGLYKPADYERFAGNRVKLRTASAINGQRNFRGKLIGIDQNVITIEADLIGLVEIAYDQIAKANIEYEF